MPIFEELETFMFLLSYFIIVVVKFPMSDSLSEE